MSPLRELAEYSSMLLTDAENQHTSEAATLKWYMTEIHWKREAALLKHLKSPIFVMELMESYCIPSLQGRANTYPFVNAMGGRSSLLSDVGVVKTAQHARAILRSISGAVDWCHRHGVVHLNIQPGSFFLEDGIDPKTEDAPWKLWDFTCARFMGEPIGAVGGGGDPGSRPVSRVITSPQPPPNHLSPDAYPYLDQANLQEQLDRIGGNPLPAAYTAPELLEAWRSGDTTFPVEAAMDSWSLGCVYYEILTGHPLFQTEADAWGMIGGWENKAPWISKTFRVPYPPTPSIQGSAVTETTLVSSGPGPKSELTMGSEDNTTTPYERSMILDPSGSIAQLLQDMMKVQADERASLESIMERIY
jgi:serine/threonine protein kinase